MRKENYENIRQTFDDIIKKSVEMEMDDSVSPLTREDVKKVIKKFVPTFIDLEE